MNENDAYVRDAIRRLKRKGVQLWVEGDSLHYRGPPGSVTQDEKAFLRRARHDAIDIVAHTNHQESAGRFAVEPPQRRDPDYAPLSFTQQAHWNLYRLRERPSLRQIASALRLRGPWDIEMLKQSLHHVLSRHEALRTRIVVRNGMPEQEISGIVDLNLETDDLSSLRASIRGQAVLDRLAEHVLEPVRLPSDRLLGCLLIREGELEYTLLLSMEHMISDAVSMNILLRDIFAVYERLSRGVESVPAPPAVQFPEFARWLRGTQDRRCQAHGRYWREHLLEREYTPFPRDLDLPLESAPAWDMVAIEIPGDLRIDLQKWSRQNRTTLVLCVLTAYIGLLSRWCNMSRTVVQCLSDGRQSIELRETIGYFATPLFICIETPDTITLPELLRLVVMEYCEAVDHADCSYLETLVPRPAFCRACIFNWVPQGRNYDRDLRLQSSSDMVCEPMAFGQPMLKRLGRDNDPGMTLFDTGQAITGGLYFPVCRFFYGTMDRFAKAFLTLLEEMPKHSNLSIGSIAV